MYGNPLKNDAWYEPPEPTGMTDEELEEETSAALSNKGTVADAIYNVMQEDNEVFKMFHMEHSAIAFRELLYERVLTIIQSDIMAGES